MNLLQVQAIRELGLLRGSSNPRRLQDENGKTYIAKGLHSRINNPYVLVNEFICYSLALELQLAVPLFAVIEFEGEPWFGSMEESIETDVMTPDILTLDIINLPEVVQLAVFDVFVRNQDRAFRNILAQKGLTENRAEYVYTLKGIDFGHALIPPAGFTWIEGSTDPMVYYRDSDILNPEIIQKPEWIEDGIVRIQSIQQDLLRSIIRKVPEIWWPDSSPRDAKKRLERIIILWRNQIRQDAIRCLERFVAE